MKELSLFQLPAYSLFFSKRTVFFSKDTHEQFFMFFYFTYVHSSKSIHKPEACKFRQPDFVDGNSIRMVETMQCTIGFQPDFFLQKLLRHFISYTLRSAGEP